MKTISYTFNITFAFLVTLLLSACATSDNSLRESGRSESYIIGFHDGRHSGMAQAGNAFEHNVRDVTRFNSDSDYQSGWLAGQEEGVRIQSSANKSVATSMGASMQKERDKNNIDKSARDAVKGVDTTGMDQLGK